MKKSSRSKPKKSNPPARRPAKTWFVAITLTLAIAAAGIVSRSYFQKKVHTDYVPRARGTLTFTKDVAPIVFQNCVLCHQPGQAAPFSLLTYAEVSKRAKQIVEVTERRYMPPWPPESGYGDFAGERRLTLDQIGVLRQWTEEGMAEGRAADLPAPPQAQAGWQLGIPDLVVRMPEPYSLAAEGRDIYRNFVLRVPGTVPRYVRAVEFQPGATKAVHHAFVKLDRTPESRHLDEKDAEVGFPGMSVPAEMPGGHFLTWQPGRVVSAVPDGLAWRLDPGNDLVLQLHLNPTGKPETVQASVGLYFAPQAPTNTCFKFVLTSLVLEIPAAESNYVVTDSYVLPVDADILAVLPHAHYLAKEMQGYATLPNGTKQWLLWIKNWDFNWQGDYRYARPIFLPRGTALLMRFTYDNSEHNPHNPNHPPQPVAYGPQSKDEMAELWFQIVPRSPQDLALLQKDYEKKSSNVFFEYDQQQLRKKPNDPEAHVEIGMLYYGQGRFTEASEHWQRALQLRPQDDRPHYWMGLLFRQQNKPADARREFEAAVRLNDKNYKAHGNLGILAAEEGKAAEAESHFRNALRVNPDDALARELLEKVQKSSKGTR